MPPVPSPTIGLKLVEFTGILVPTSSLASALFRTTTEGVDSTRTLDWLSSAEMTAAALRPRKVQPRPPSPVMLPAMSPQMSRPSALGRSLSATASSKNQLTPYLSLPLSSTSTTCASICTCSGMVSRRSMVRRIDSHWPGVARTSSAFDSSTALTDTSSDEPTAMPSPARPPRLALAACSAALARAPGSAASGAGVLMERICTGSRPGISEGGPLALLPPDAE